MAAPAATPSRGGEGRRDEPGGGGESERDTCSQSSAYKAPGAAAAPTRTGEVKQPSRAPFLQRLASFPAGQVFHVGGAYCGYSEPQGKAAKRRRGKAKFSSNAVHQSRYGSPPDPLLLKPGCFKVLRAVFGKGGCKSLYQPSLSLWRLNSRLKLLGSFLDTHLLQDPEWALAQQS